MLFTKRRSSRQRISTEQLRNGAQRRRDKTPDDRWLQVTATSLLSIRRALLLPQEIIGPTHQYLE
jgi:hypothetical protein